MYVKTDPRFRDVPARINPLIDRELAKHKIIIEERYGRSLMNKNYKFPKLINIERTGDSSNTQ